MTQYALIYIGEPKFDTPEAGAASQQEWETWLSGLGDAVVNPGMPFGPAKRVGTGGVTDVTSANRLTGVTIVDADSIDAAIDMAKTCPYIQQECSVDVAEVFQM